jgi:hypothetical protein
MRKLWSRSPILVTSCLALLLFLTGQPVFAMTKCMVKYTTRENHRNVQLHTFYGPSKTSLTGSIQSFCDGSENQCRESSCSEDETAEAANVRENPVVSSLLSLQISALKQISKRLRPESFSIHAEREDTAGGVHHPRVASSAAKNYLTQSESDETPDSARNLLEATQPD